MLTDKEVDDIELDVEGDEGLEQLVEDWRTMKKALADLGIELVDE